MAADDGSAEDPFAGPLGAAAGTFDTVTLRFSPCLYNAELSPS
jgi:hypothetical protein